MNRRIATAMAALGAAAIVTVAAGCGSDSASVPTGADMKGTWSQSGSGYENGAPITWSDNVLVIDKANGQAFAGYKEFTPPGGQKLRETINGVIAPDGDILIADPDGFFEGTLADGVMTGQYAETSPAENQALNVTLTKQ